MAATTILAIDDYVDFLLQTNKELTIYKNKLLEKSDYDDEYYDYVCEKVSEYYESKLPEINSEIKKFQNRNITKNQHSSGFTNTGIIVTKINVDIKTSTLELINKFSTKSKIDFHPGSEDRVRDLVHPSVYPLVRDDQKEPNVKKTDFWSRPYESSKFQWLPSEFKIDAGGKCEIKSYINNLPIEEYELYNNISNLFDTVLPDLEKSWSYANSIHIYKENTNMCGNIHNKLENISLKNKNLQVITKIVQIHLKPNDQFMGSWHVEGMSHENIVATASCTLEQSDDIKTKLYFKRGYYEEEADHLLMNSHNVPSEIHDLYHSKLVPIGKVNIKEDTIVVFPNNMVHKVDMINKSDEAKTRTIVVFWLIDPNVRITSTQDIPQQNYDWIEAQKVRLNLMKERTFHKQSFNQREINLCEH